MANLPVKYKTTLEHIRNSGIAEIDCILFRIMPDACFGLLTYETDDFYKGNITYLLYTGIPKTFSVTVGKNDSLQAAINSLADINPHINIEPAGAVFLSHEIATGGRKTQELLVMSKKMFVCRDGTLAGDHSTGIY